MEHRYSLLLADGHAALRQRLADSLTADGYAVAQTRDTRDDIKAWLATTTPDALILCDTDPASPPPRVLVDLRAGSLSPAARAVPTVVLASEPRPLALLQCFEAGADDYLARWTTHPELRARIGAVLARSYERDPCRPRRLRVVGPLAVDLDSQTATWEGERLDLSNLEFALLAQLAADPTRVHHKDDLLRDVWGFQTPGKTRTVEFHARQLRRKLADAGASGWIVTRHALGLQLIDPRAGASPDPSAVA